VKVVHALGQPDIVVVELESLGVIDIVRKEGELYLFLVGVCYEWRGYLSTTVSAN